MALRTFRMTRIRFTTTFLMVLNIGIAAEYLENMPKFVSNTPTEVSVYQGQRARLMCSVNNLRGKEVTWRLKDSQSSLAVSTFTSSDKYSVEHDDASEWNLIINQVDLSHSGIYQCMVPTHPKPVFREIHLTVKAVTLGEKKVVYVQEGQELRLQCNSSLTQTCYSAVERVPPEVEWFRGDGNVINSYDNNDIVITTQVMNGLRVSTLIIERSDMDDAGVYICRNTEQGRDQVTVRIINVESPNSNVKNPSSRNGSVITSISFTLILSLLFLCLT